MLIIGYLVNIYNIELGLSLPCVFTYTFFYFLGVWFSEVKIFEKLCLKMQIMMSLAAFILLLVISMKTDWIGATGANSYTGVGRMLFMSVAGWVFVKGLAVIIAQYCKFISKFLKNIGRDTIVIMFLNFFAFKLVILIQIDVFDLPMTTLSYFPIYSTKGVWWIVYSFTGVFIPIFLKNIYIKTVEMNKRIVKRTFWRKKKRA